MTTFNCQYCQTELPHFKALVEHYEAEHREHLRWYRVDRKDKGGQAIIRATSKQEVCRLLNWKEADCIISLEPESPCSKTFGE